MSTTGPAVGVERSSLRPGVPAVAIAWRAEFVVGVYAQVPALVDMHNKVVTLHADRVNDVLIDDRHKLLDAVLCDALIDYERAVDHAMGEVQVKPADRLAVFQDGITLGLLGADFTLEVESGHTGGLCCFLLAGCGIMPEWRISCDVASILYFKNIHNMGRE